MPNIKETQSLSIAKHIEKSQKKITILFTDIVDSTKHWDTVGDVQARLSVDLHNRLLFSVIKKFRGRVLKTIGDSIMASFKSPDNAIRAAIGCQQMLERERNRNEAFSLHIRIGIHSGKAIIEHNDVFGDVVNVASRVESEAGKGEICVSSKTQKILKKKYSLKKAGSFTPKGKNKKLVLYACGWSKHPSLIDTIKVSSFLPVNKKQRREIALYFFCTLGWLYYIYTYILRFVIADTKELSLAILDPIQTIQEFPYIVTPLVIALAYSGYKLFNYTHLSYTIFRLLKGGMYGAIVFILAHAYFLITPIEHKQKNMFVSEHLFVEIQLADVHVRESMSTFAPAVKLVQDGDLLLLLDVQKKDGITWNKVLIGTEQSGWVPRVIPPRMGVPEKRVSKADKFYYTLHDVYCLIAAFVGWLIGVFSFRIKPV